MTSAAEDTPLLAAIRAEHRRVLGLFRPLEETRDDFERIEQMSVICEEIRHLLTAGHCVVWPLLEPRLVERHDPVPAATADARIAATDARLREAGLLSLVERLEQLSPEEADFDVLARHAYDTLREYVQGQERDLFPLLSRVDEPSLQHAELRLRDLRERLTEH